MHHAQIHLTNNCNLKCLHCYQNSYSTPVMSIDNYKLLINELKTNGVSSISLTGGEPFTIKNFKDYLDLSVNNFNNIAILTNGLLINDDICEYLVDASKKVKIAVQVSLEGTKKINDSIRGEGTFDRITKSIDFMKSKGIPFVTVSCTIAPYNYNKLDELYFYLSDNTKADCMWFDRLIPIKREDYISTSQFKIVLNQLKSIGALYNSGITRMKVKRIRALQFLATEENVCYRCSAGVETVTIMPNMDVMLCRRLNFSVGNLADKSLSEILVDSKDLINQIHSIPDDCKSCKYAKACSGGLRCLTYNKYHDFNHKDINCFVNRRGFLKMNFFTPFFKNIYIIPGNEVKSGVLEFIYKSSLELQYTNILIELNDNYKEINSILDDIIYFNNASIILVNTGENYDYTKLDIPNNADIKYCNNINFAGKVINNLGVYIDLNNFDSKRLVSFFNKNIEFDNNVGFNFLVTTVHNDINNIIEFAVNSEFINTYDKSSNILNQFIDDTFEYLNRVNKSSTTLDKYINITNETIKLTSKGDIISFRSNDVIGNLFDNTNYEILFKLIANDMGLDMGLD